MPTDDLRSAVTGLMGRAKDDLSELVAFKSVADAKQYPPEECEAAAQWVIDAFTEAGLEDVTASPTPDGSKAVHGHLPAPDGAPTVLLYCQFGGPAPDPVLGLIRMLATLHDERGNTTIDGLDNTQTWTGVDYTAEQFRDDANVLDGVELVGDGSACGCPPG